ncbi:MAG: hypothetical protein M0Z91_10705 [Actinomycetota bacterium]|nr:hypothetical protein [Actinomycetota bacterium]
MDSSHVNLAYCPFFDELSGGDTFEVRAMPLTTDRAAVHQSILGTSSACRLTRGSSST